jgi:hypothetical protein
MLFEFESTQQVLAAFSSLEFVRRDPAVFDRLPSHVAAAIAVGLQVDLWNPLCVGSLIAIPVRPLPHDPVEALVALATLPLVGARVRSVSALGVLELCIERWPRSCAVFDGGGEKVFRCGRLISAPLPALPETLVVVSVLDPESYFRPVLEPQGKSIGASVSFGSQVQQPGDVVSECSGTVCAVTQKLKPVAQFQFIDDDGMAHIISSNADAAGRYDKVRGLLRVWSPALIFKFVRDLEIDFSAMCREIGFAGLPTFAGMEGGFFPLVRRVRHSPCLSSPGQVERVVCAQWCLTDPARLRLSDLAAEPVVWPAPSAPALQEAGRVTLRATLINIGRVLAAVWHTAFLGAFQPFIDLLDDTPNIPERYSVIYLVSRIEIALSSFAQVVFRSPGSPPVAGPRGGFRSASEWAGVLTAAIHKASDTSRWELPPTREFFEFGGEFTSLFAMTPRDKVDRGGKKRVVDVVDQSADTSSTLKKRPKDDRICYTMMASWLKAKGADGKAFPACARDPCRFPHDIQRLQKLSVAQLQEVANRAPPRFTEGLLAAIQARAPLLK